MKYLIMMTGNWTDTEAMNNAYDISAWIDNYIGNTGNLVRDLQGAGLYGI